MKSEVTFVRINNNGRVTVCRNYLDGIRIEFRDYDLTSRTARRLFSALNTICSEWEIDVATDSDGWMDVIYCNPTYNLLRPEHTRIKQVF